MVQYFEIVDKEDFPVARWIRHPGKKKAELAAKSVKGTLKIGVSTSLVSRIYRLHDEYMRVYGGTPADKHCVHYISQQLGEQEALVRVVIKGRKP